LSAYIIKYELIILSIIYIYVYSFQITKIIVKKIYILFSITLCVFVCSKIYRGKDGIVQYTEVLYINILYVQFRETVEDIILLQ